VASAVLVTEPVCTAVMLTSPVVPRAAAPLGAAPSSAVVLSLETITAAAGVTATPPADPASTSAVVVCVELAPMVSLPTWARPALSPTSASAVLFLGRLRATEAPTPRVDEPFAWDVAAALLVVVLVASMVTSPPPASTFAPPWMTAELVWLGMSLRANAPATPTLLEPAPEVAVAPNALGAGINASTVTPLAETPPVPPIDAWLSACPARLMATATPTPPSVALIVLLPSALVVSFEHDEAVTPKGPPDVTDPAEAM
jgi:hypothetical protein